MYKEFTSKDFETENPEVIKQEMRQAREEEQKLKEKKEERLKLTDKKKG